MILINFLKKITHPILKYAVFKYLSKDRNYSFSGIKISVHQGVFHPGFFFSSKCFFRFLKEKDLNKKTLLEVGCGSGILSILAAKKGAIVTAIDINEQATNNTIINAKKNNVDLNVFTSDLFDAVPQQTFDFIIINPPFYPKTPDNKQEFAWYCGENFEYFEKFFNQLNSYIHHNTKIWMILSDDGDLSPIIEIANSKNYEMNIASEKNKIVEKLFIYEIQKIK